MSDWNETIQKMQAGSPLSTPAAQGTGALTVEDQRLLDKALMASTEVICAIPSPGALPASGVDVSAIMEMFGRWQSGYAFNDDSDDDVDLEQRVEAEIAALTYAPAPEDRT